MKSEKATTKGVGGKSRHSARSFFREHVLTQPLAHSVSKARPADWVKVVSPVRKPDPAAVVTAEPLFAFNAGGQGVETVTIPPGNPLQTTRC